jgi:site-specific DNA-methyltransferase (cytosine-N4-specific)
MLTDARDFVVDPFGGSCITGEVAERLNRRWLCSELQEEYVLGAVGRFEGPAGYEEKLFPTGIANQEDTSYKICHPAALWTDDEGPLLPKDGGKKRQPTNGD